MIVIFVMVCVQTVISLFHLSTLDHPSFFPLTLTMPDLPLKHSFPRSKTSSAKQKTEYISIQYRQLSSPKDMLA